VGGWWSVNACDCPYLQGIRVNHEAAKRGAEQPRLCNGDHGGAAAGPDRRVPLAC
jgi:hypothetical protein